MSLKGVGMEPWPDEMSLKSFSALDGNTSIGFMPSGAGYRYCWDSSAGAHVAVEGCRL